MSGRPAAASTVTAPFSISRGRPPAARRPAQGPCYHRPRTPAGEGRRRPKQPRGARVERRRPPASRGDRQSHFAARPRQHGAVAASLVASGLGRRRRQGRPRGVDNGAPCGASCDPEVKGWRWEAWVRSWRCVWGAGRRCWVVGCRRASWWRCWAVPVAGRRGVGRQGASACVFTAVVPWFQGEFVWSGIYDLP